MGSEKANWKEDIIRYFTYTDWKNSKSVYRGLSNT